MTTALAPQPALPRLHPTPLLRHALLGDALASGAMGLLLAAGATPLAPLLGLAEPLLRGAGLALLPYAALVGWLGRQAAPRRAAVRAVIAANLLWVAESLVLAAWLAPTPLGLGALLLQAAVVLGFAAAQAAGVRSAQAAGVRSAQAAGVRSAQAAGVRSAQAAGAHAAPLVR